ncbi:MAG TPA: glycosyltransferase family A protein, partial [Chitinophagaceae bacterium]|nr:glycosyltransferase family A protein [Chitinophagaceae bacterium]
MSIIIPVYNSERYLAKTLESILEQTYPNKEIIVIDDSSTDNSFTIAKSFEAKGIKVLRQKNAGAAVARNTGLASATGDYIQFLDADDYLSNDKIEKQVMALDGATDKVAVCNYVSFTNDKELEKKITPPDQSSYIFSSDDPVSFLLNLWGSNGESEFIQTNCWLVPHPLIKKAGPWRNYRC